MLERLLKNPGFVYYMNGRYYHLGKWICKECQDTDAADCLAMYEMCRAEHEEDETETYFQKLRAYSDFALDIPYNPELIKENMTALLDGLPPDTQKCLACQIQHFEEDQLKYCKELSA